MNVITHRRLKEFGDKHQGAAEPLDNWYRRARKARWQNLAEVKIEAHVSLECELNLLSVCRVAAP